MTLFHSAIDKLYTHSQSGLPVAQSNQSKTIQFQQKWLPIFIHDCIDCRMHKYKNMKRSKAAILPFSKLWNCSIHSFLMDTKGPLNTDSEWNFYVYINVDNLSNYFVTLPTTKNKAYQAPTSLIHHSISKFSHLQCLIRGKSTEYLIWKSWSKDWKVFKVGRHICSQNVYQWNDKSYHLNQLVV